MVNKFLSLMILFFAVQYTAQAQGMPDDDITKPAPDSFLVAFETSKGDFEAMVHRSWAPLAADRFYHLVRLEFYNDVGIYRVVKNFIAQFGLQNSAKLNRAWSRIPLDDEPVIKSNVKGTISFARGGPKTRTTVLFINLRDNSSLDKAPVGGVVGYPPFATITSGLEIAESFYAEYGNAPVNHQDAIEATGRRFLDNQYPGLDFIKTVRVIEEY